jgi:hypothetical protein
VIGAVIYKGCTSRTHCGKLLPISCPQRKPPRGHSPLGGSSFLGYSRNNSCNTRVFQIESFLLEATNKGEDSMQIRNDWNYEKITEVAEAHHVSTSAVDRYDANLCSLQVGDYINLGGEVVEVDYIHSDSVTAYDFSGKEYEFVIADALTFKVARVNY